jgi:hypothetical protein
MAQTQDFTKELDRINRDEITYRFSGTGLSYAESISLVADLGEIERPHRYSDLLVKQLEWSGIDGQSAELFLSRLDKRSWRRKSMGPRLRN